MAAGDIITIHESGSGKKGNIFDGTDDYVLHDAHAVARVAAGDTQGTYTAWIYVDNIVGSKTILSAGDNNVDESMVFRIYNNKLSVVVYQGAATQLDVTQTVGTLEARTWTHVALVQNGTRPNLYINGIMIDVTDSTSTDLTAWYNVITGADKFAIGAKETNGAHLVDWKGAIGQVKYWPLALSESEILNDMHGRTKSEDSVREAALDAALVFNITMENDGITDSGTGADDGTLTGDAYYGGLISDHSYQLAANVTGHAAEEISTILEGDKLRTIIKRGD